jgi:hypothetical protein
MQSEHLGTPPSLAFVHLVRHSPLFAPLFEKFKVPADENDVMAFVLLAIAMAQELKEPGFKPRTTGELDEANWRNAKVFSLIRSLELKSSDDPQRRLGMPDILNGIAEGSYPKLKPLLRATTKEGLRARYLTGRTFLTDWHGDLEQPFVIAAIHAHAAATDISVLARSFRKYPERAGKRRLRVV